MDELVWDVCACVLCVVLCLGRFSGMYCGPDPLL